VLFRKASFFNRCFQDTDISHGSVATHFLRCGGTCSNSIITIFLLILTVRKSLKIG